MFAGVVVELRRKEEAIVPAFNVGHYELIREVRPSAELCGGAELDLCMTKIAQERIFLMHD